MSVGALKYRQMAIIRLSGPLIRELGRKYRRQPNTGSVQEVFSVLHNTLPGFKEVIMRLQRLGMRFAIYRSHRNVGEDEFSIYDAKGVRVVPAIAGSKRAGLVQTIIGTTMVVVTTTATNGIDGFAAGGAWGFAGATGVSLTLDGVIQMLSPQTQGLKQSVAPENLPSYAFGSARSTIVSGNPASICYGKHHWGGVIISVSIYAEDKT